MAACRAIQTGEGFKSHCVRESSGAVHSVFHRAVNIKSGNVLLCIATAELGGAYHTLNVSETDLTFFIPGQPFRFDLECVKVGNISIALCSVPLYRSPLPRMLRGTVSESIVLRFKQIMDRNAPNAGIHTGREPELLHLLSTKEHAATAAERLVGLGPGLTPAGDDLLLGYLAILNHMGDSVLHETLRKAILKRLSGTTDVSAQMLHDAAFGHYPERAAAVVAALCRGEAESLTVLLPRLMEVGATSGSDMAAGMFAALCTCSMAFVPAAM